MQFLIFKGFRYNRFIHHNRNFLERISTKIKGYISKFKETVSIIKFKNLAEFDVEGKEVTGKLKKEINNSSTLNRQKKAKDYLSPKELASLTNESDPYAFLTKEEQAIFDATGEKSFEEWTQEEKNVFYKYDSILRKIFNLETINEEKAQQYKLFIIYYFL